MSGPEHPGTLCSSRGRRAQNPLASEVVREDLRHQFARDCLAPDRRQMLHRRGVDPLGLIFVDEREDNLGPPITVGGPSSSETATSATCLTKSMSRK